MVERIQSAYHKKLVGDRSLEQDLRDQGHQFKQGEIVTKEKLTEIINGAAKPCTLRCRINGQSREFPLTDKNSNQVYINLARLINTYEVRGLEVKDG